MCLDLFNITSLDGHHRFFFYVWGFLDGIIMSLSTMKIWFVFKCMSFCKMGYNILVNKILHCTDKKEPSSFSSNLRESIQGKSGLLQVSIFTLVQVIRSVVISDFLWHFLPQYLDASSQHYWVGHSGFKEAWLNAENFDSKWYHVSPEKGELFSFVSISVVSFAKIVQIKNLNWTKLNVVIFFKSQWLSFI